MQWTRKSSWYIESDAGYKICKCQVLDRITYTAFAPRVNNMPIPIGRDISAEPLKIICQKHFDKVDCSL